MLNELVHPHHEQEETLVDDGPDAAANAERQQLPWWRRPSPWWLMLCTPFSTIAMSATLAPKIEIYTLLACSVHKPEIFRDSRLLSHVPSSLALHQALVETTFPPSFDIAINNATAPIISMDTPHASPCASDPVVIAAVAKLTTGECLPLAVTHCVEVSGQPSPPPWVS
jgi:hypothetical protein